MSRLARTIQSRFLSNRRAPPTYFGSLSNPPKTLDEWRSESASVPPPPVPSQSFQEDDRSQSYTRGASSASEGAHRIGKAKDFALSLSLMVVSGLLIVNVMMEREAEKETEELTRKYQKNLKALQLKFQQQNRQKTLQALAESKKSLQREMKMSLHIALLREQLAEHGIQPVSIDDAVSEFENHVKGDNALAVVPQTLWVSDNSSLKAQFPDIHEYDKRD